jgi:hypothetical protein
VAIKDGYLRYLSSNLVEDHNAALINFWNEIKQLETIDSDTEEAIVMYFNYYLEYIGPPLKTNAIKTLILFHKQHPSRQTYALNHVYARVLSNMF